MHWDKPVLGKLLLITFYHIVFIQKLVAQHPAADSAVYRSLDEVVVTGMAGQQTLKQSVFTIRTINATTIRARAANDTYALLAMEPGIRLAPDNALGETDISILGMGGNTVKVLLNGVPLLDRSSIRQSLGQIDINSIERIEIVEGPMSVLYGSDALAGVVNIITKRAGSGTSNLSIHAKLQEESMGSNYAPLWDDGIHQKHISVRGKFGAFSASGYLTSMDMGGWKGNAPLRAKDIRPKEQLVTGTDFGYQGKNASISYRLDYLKEELYAPGQYNQNNTAVDAYYTTNRFTQQALGSWKPASNLGLEAAAGMQHYTRNTATYRLDFVNGTKQPSQNTGEWDEIKFNSFFSRLNANWQLNKWFTAQPGLEFKTEQGSGDRIIGNPRINDMAIFLSGELKPMKKVVVRPGLRLTKNSKYDAPPVIPALNLKWQLTEQLDLRVSYGKGFRAPALRELYFEFFDANHSITGNPNLKAEYSDSYQASLSWQRANWRLRGGAFYNDFRNRIALAQGSGNVFSYFNIDRFKTAGGNLDAQWVSGRWQMQAGVLMIARYNSFYGNSDYITSTNKRFAWSPEISFQTSYDIPSIGLNAALFYKFNGALPVFRTGAVNGQDKPDVYLSKTAAYHWADITMSKSLLKRFTLQAGIKNLFDVTRLNNTATDSGTAHAEAGAVLFSYGRSWFTAIQFNWSKQNKKKNDAAIL